MRKYIALLLALVLCLGVFAGCQKTEEENPLKSATVYLFQMYNNAGVGQANKLTTDKDFTNVVVYDGVNYAVEWTVNITSGPADSIKIVESTATTIKVDIPDEPEEDITYTLTATVKDGDGKSESVSFDFFTPAVKKVEVSGEGKVVLHFPKDNKYITDSDYLYTSSSGTQKHELILSDNEADAVQLTIQNNADGTVSLKTDDGRFLLCDATNVQFVAEENDNTKFVLEGTDGGTFIKCAVANYKGKPQYLEVYSGYLTCYGMNESNAGIYTFVLKETNAVPAAAILEAAYSLGAGETLAGGPHTLTGVITSIHTPWDEGYKNITVIIDCGVADRPMMCFRMKGDGAKELAVGDTITVTGTIINYSGTIEFNSGCTFVKA